MRFWRGCHQSVAIIESIVVPPAPIAITVTVIIAIIITVTSVSTTAAASPASSSSSSSIRPWLGQVDGDPSPIKVTAIHLFHGILSIPRVRKGDESKSTRATCVIVTGQEDVGDLTVLTELPPYVTFIGIEVQIP
eukprot:1382972-Amorphochlora_amoeboformis.AAC.2